MATRTGKRGIAGDAVTRTAFVHTVIDDHSRVAYAEIRDIEKPTLPSESSDEPSR